MPDPSPIEQCPVCTQSELVQLRRDLAECKKRGQSKARQIKPLNKRVFILMMIAIGIGAIFGKEALDAITEWMGSVTDFRNGADNLLQGTVLPSPGALPLLAISCFAFRRRRRRF